MENQDKNIEILNLKEMRFFLNPQTKQRQHVPDNNKINIPEEPVELENRKMLLYPYRRRIIAGYCKILKL